MQVLTKTTLVTHLAPDLDALLGMWILIRFGGHSNYELAFVPVGKRLEGKGDAIHVDTGLAQFDHHQTSANTCAAQLVYETVFHDRDEPAVAELVEFALLTDWYRKPEETNGPFTINSVIDGLNQLYPNDPECVAERAFEMLDAVYRSLTSRLKAEREYADGFTFTSVFGQAFAISSGMPHIRSLAHLKGAKVVVFVDPLTGFRGYKARSQDGVDFSSVFERIRRLEPEADWFLHSSKELLLCGSPKAPDRRLSKLSLQQLVELVAEDEAKRSLLIDSARRA